MKPDAEPPAETPAKKKRKVRYEILVRPDEKACEVMTDAGLTIDNVWIKMLVPKDKTLKRAEDATAYLRSIGFTGTFKVVAVRMEGTAKSETRTVIDLK